MPRLRISCADLLALYSSTHWRLGDNRTTKLTCRVAERSLASLKAYLQPPEVRVLPNFGATSLIGQWDLSLPPRQWSYCENEPPYRLAWQRLGLASQRDGGGCRNHPRTVD